MALLRKHEVLNFKTQCNTTVSLVAFLLRAARTKPNFSNIYEHQTFRITINVTK